MQACADTVLAYWQPTVQGEKPSKRKQNEKTKKTKLKTKKNIVVRVYTGTLAQ